MSFFKFPREAMENNESKQMEHINIERFYDYDTNSYLMKFKSPEALDSMKKMH